MVGRPPEPVPQDIADEIVEWISQGKTLRSYCRQPGKPARRTVDDWREKDEIFAARVARARDDGFAEIAEECMQIADTPLAGVTTTVDDSEKGGTRTVTEDMLGHRKLQVETRLKLLACWDPRRYGNKVALGGDPTGVPLQTQSLTQDEIERRVASLIATANARVAATGEAK